MNRQSVSEPQKQKNAALQSSANVLQRKTKSRTGLGAVTIDAQGILEQQDSKNRLLSSKSPFNHDFSKIPARFNSPYPIQAKLKIGQPNDKYEQEADRVAEQVMRMPEPRIPSSVEDSTHANSSAPQDGTIQRACASCSAEYKTTEDENRSVKSTNLCSKCRTQEQGLIQTKPITPLVQTKADANLTPEVSPALSSDIQSLQGGGQPLSESERGFFEPRFGADFSNVRIHNDSRAISAAQSINARAFTLGQNVVFGDGEYSSDSVTGRKLLAHELTHTIQQGGEQLTMQGMIQRESVIENVSRLFGGGTFSVTELQSYLETLDTTGNIEDAFDSDNKARTIVEQWKLGGSPFVLTAQRKASLIREMLSGFTGNDDEQAILELLERSFNFELTIIFGPGGISADELNTSVHGEEWAQLQDFYSRRFDGGMAAVLLGTITPIGDAVPVGTSLPTAGVPAGTPLIGGSEDWNVPCVLALLCPLDHAVVTQLQSTTVNVADRIFWEDPFYDGAQWTTRTFEGGGSSSANLRRIGLLSGASCSSAVDTVVHEIRHQNQPPGGTTLHNESDAYRFTEQWLIDRGIPGRASFRGTDPVTGATIVNDAAIDVFVRARYPGPTAGGSPGDQVVGREPNGDAIVERPDGTTYTRSPQAGDSFPAPMQVVNSRIINSALWQCS